VIAIYTSIVISDRNKNSKERKMTNRLDGKKIAILVAHGFEESEMTEPKKALEEAGAITEIVSPEGSNVKAWNKDDWSKEYKVDKELTSANADDYNGLLLPGGVMNPDRLRNNEKAVDFVKSFFESGKPIGAICHGPWTMIETGALDGRKLTSYPSIRTDLENAGAKWVDEEVVVDEGLVTSRKPDDIPAFNRKLVEEYAEGVHEEQATV
jgi:protease I